MTVPCCPWPSVYWKAWYLEVIMIGKKQAFAYRNLLGETGYPKSWMDMAIWNLGVGIFDIKSIIHNTFIGYNYAIHNKPKNTKWVRKHFFWRASLKSSSTVRKWVERTPFKKFRNYLQAIPNKYAVYVQKWLQYKQGFKANCFSPTSKQQPKHHLHTKKF